MRYVVLVLMLMLALTGCVSGEEAEQMQAENEAANAQAEAERTLEQRMNDDWYRQWENAPEDLTVISRSAQADVYEQSGIVCMRTWSVDTGSIAVDCDFTNYAGNSSLPVFPSPTPSPSEF